MPNNPGRIDGDYSIGEKEQITYVDPPPNYGAVKKSTFNRMYVIFAVIILILVIIWILLR